MPIDIRYFAPNGEQTDPCKYLYDSWVSDHLMSVWPNLLGFFILNNAPGFFTELNDYPTVDPKDAPEVELKSRVIDGYLSLADVFRRDTWYDPECQEFVMDPTVHAAFIEALASGNLVTGSLRLVASLAADRIKLRLLWIERISR